MLVEQGQSFVETDAIVRAAMGHNKGVSDRLAVVSLLCQHGAPVNVYHLKFWDHEMWESLILIYKLMTPLHHAAAGGKADMVALLLDLGADRSKLAVKRETPRDLAIKNGHLDVVELLGM